MPNFDDHVELELENEEEEDASEAPRGFVINSERQYDSREAGTTYVGESYHAYITNYTFAGMW